MEYCANCLMPDTRPGIEFTGGVCDPCINYERQKETDWGIRWLQLAECKRLKARGKVQCYDGLSTLIIS